MSLSGTETTSRAAARLIAPAMPLALLESVRSTDRPGEVLEDEDLASSMPRRLGLSGIIDTQIRRYEQPKRWVPSVPLDEVASLLRLVLRRPDAGTILFEAGRDLARMRTARRSATQRAALRMLPKAALYGAARRAAQRLLRAASAGTKLEVSGKPLVVRLWQPELAQLDEIGTACRLYTGALEELLLLHTGAPHAVAHVQCMALARECCEWRAA